MTVKFKWTEKIITRICDELSGGSSIIDIAGKNGLPAYATIYREMANNEDFRKRISKAREAQQEYEIDQCVKMADEATTEDWQVARLRIWARQWRITKLAPKKYGTTTEQGNGGDQKPAAEKLPPVEPQTMEEAESQYRRLLEL